MGADVNMTDGKGRGPLYFSKKYGLTNVIEKIYKIMFKKQKQYYEELIEQKLREQKEQLLHELYQPDGLGYAVSKERFEKTNYKKN